MSGISNLTKTLLFLLSWGYVYVVIYDDLYTGQPKCLARHHRSTRQRYLQWFPPTHSWRFRRTVPRHLRAAIGKAEFTQTLAPKRRQDAERLIPPLAAETDWIIALAEAGNWPSIPDQTIIDLAHGWWRWFQFEKSRVMRNPKGEIAWPWGTSLWFINESLWALTSEEELAASVRRFVRGPRDWPLAGC